MFSEQQANAEPVSASPTILEAGRARPADCRVASGRSASARRALGQVPHPVLPDRLENTHQTGLGPVAAQVVESRPAQGHPLREAAGQELRVLQAEVQTLRGQVEVLTRTGEELAAQHARTRTQRDRLANAFQKVSAALGEARSRVAALEGEVEALRLRDEIEPQRPGREPERLSQHDAPSDATEAGDD